MTTQDDKTLLELAAWSIGHEIDWNTDVHELTLPKVKGCYWNPLTDDGDALRLAVKLNIVIWEHGQYDRAMAEVRYGKARGEYWELGDDPYAATRRAIVRAAASIGESL